ncbi:MAG TPA: SRPBCC domain-containing protein [Alloacidobacterium sp.]|nr:SRPBCC domain-containing protein [Alloacidobacterium sp.]
MTQNAQEQGLQTLEIKRRVEVAAPIDVVFESVLEQLGPLNEEPDGSAMPMRLEAWPGGRWFRDFGEKGGHWWGSVQSIRQPDLLEIHGPMFMSAPVVSHILFRLKEENGVTLIDFSHRAVGLIPEMFLDGKEINTGWGNYLSKVTALAEKRSTKR